MKKIEIVISGRREEKTARQMLQGIYRAISDVPACTDVSVQIMTEKGARTDTIPRLLNCREGA